VARRHEGRRVTEHLALLEFTEALEDKAEALDELRRRFGHMGR
jgi:hypothetical protein